MFHRLIVLLTVFVFSFSGTNRPAYFWFGGFSTTCKAWVGTATSFTDPPVDTTCALNTVSSYGITPTIHSDGEGGYLPGIELTFPNTNKYQICAFSNVTTTLAGATLGLRVYEKTTSTSLTALPLRQANTGGGNGYGHTLHLCSYFTPADTTTTYKFVLQYQASAGNARMGTLSNLYRTAYISVAEHDSMIAGR